VAVRGWILDKSAAVRASQERFANQLAELAGSLFLCHVVFESALSLQRDLAHHHGMWHRISIPDLLIACTALQHGLGVVHVDSDFERIAEVRPLVVRRLT